MLERLISDYVKFGGADISRLFILFLLKLVEI